jgi:hypothetical protein
MDKNTRPTPFSSVHLGIEPPRCPSPEKPGDPTAAACGPPPSPRLLDCLRGEIRARHYSIRTEATYVDWARRYILFHDKRHPKEMGATAGRLH